MIPRLDDVVVFGPDDADAVRKLTVDLYGIRPEAERLAQAGPDRRRRMMFRLLAGDRPRHHAPLDGATIRNVVLFRYDAIGDYIVSTPIIRWIRHCLPEAAIDVVGSYRNHPMLAIDPNIRQVIDIHPSHGFRPSWLRLRRLGRRVDYDAVLAVVFTRMTKAGILTRLVGRDACTVTIRHDARVATYGALFDVQTPHDLPEHYAHTMFRMVTQTFTPVVPPVAGLERPYIVLDDEAVRRCRAWCTSNGLAWTRPASADVVMGEAVSGLTSTEGRPYIFVNISAYSPNRNWSSARCAETVRLLRARHPDHAVVVSGAPDVAAEVAAVVTAVADGEVVAWKGSLLDLLSVVASASYVVTPDTSIVHIAAAAGRPCVVLFAELIKVAEWYPFGVPYRGVLSADPESINGIDSTTIAEALTDLRHSVEG